MKSELVKYENQVRSIHDAISRWACEHVRDGRAKSAFGSIQTHRQNTFGLQQAHKQIDIGPIRILGGHRSLV